MGDPGWDGLQPGFLRGLGDRPVALEVYSAVNRDVRSVSVVPSVTWGSNEGLLGISVRACNYTDALKSWHVLEVQPGSPADMAGLRQEVDYIIGSRNGVLRDKEDLFELIEENVDRAAVHLAVYSKDTEKCHEVGCWLSEGKKSFANDTSPGSKPHRL